MKVTGAAGSERSARGRARLVLLASITLLAARPARPDQPCRVDSVGGVLAQDGVVGLCGWAVDTASGRPLPELRIEIDGKAAGMVTRNMPRPDVASALNLPFGSYPGWCGQAPLTGVTSGRHVVEVIATSADGKDVTCSQQEITVLPGRIGPTNAPAGVGAKVLARLIFLLAVLTLIGAPIALVMGRRGALLGAPLLGLGLFGAGSELGRALRVTPFWVGVALAMASVISLIALRKLVIARIGRFRLASLLVLAPVALFALLGAIPFSVHGDGAVLGAIDDGTRECMYAESIRLYRWSIPPDVFGMFRMLPDQWDALGGRLGGPYLLAGLAQALDVLPHEVHSVAMLGAGCLVVLGVGWLAALLFPGRFRASLLAAGLAAAAGAILSTLYTQHLGSLLFTAFATGFAACCLLMRGPRRTATIVTAITVAGFLTFYPEGLPLALAIGAVSLLTVRSIRRARMLVGRLLIAGLLGAALNPLAIARLARDVAGAYRTPSLSTAEQRLTTGDTFYFPSLQVLTGFEPYRLDGPVFLRPPLRSVWNMASWIALVFLAAVLWRTAARRLRVYAYLLFPVGAALLANWQLRFPYGFAKFLPIGAAFVALVIADPLDRLLSGETAARRKRETRRSTLAVAAGVLVISMRLPAAYLAIRDNVRAVPAYDPAFAELSALAARVGRAAVIRIDAEPSYARRQWICYFFGENGFEPDPALVRYPGKEYYRLVDLRTDRPDPARPSLRTQTFALEILGREMKARPGPG